jgi:DNA-directed RNA polymerase sigma subunit (sigma70/sigma32)
MVFLGRMYDDDQVSRFVGQRPECLEALTDRERRILLARLPKDGKPSMTLERLAQEQGVTRERIRQIENRADRKIRRFMVRDLRRCQHCGGKGWI